MMNTLGLVQEDLWTSKQLQGYETAQLAPSTLYVACYTVVPASEL